MWCFLAAARPAPNEPVTLSSEAMSLLAVGMVSAIPLVGLLALSGNGARAERWTAALVPLAVGTLAGVASLHLVPEGVGQWGGRWLPVAALGAAGFVGFGAFERIFHWRVEERGQADAFRRLTPIVMVGDALHNAIDGILVAASFLTTPALGFLTALAIALHEIPRELGVFALLLRGGSSVKRAVGFNLFTALLAMMAAAAVLVSGHRVVGLTRWLLPIAAGNFVYLALSIGRNEWRATNDGTGALKKLLLAGIGLALTAISARH